MKAGRFPLELGYSRLVLLVVFASALSSCGGADLRDEVVHTRLGLAGKAVLALAIDPNQPSIIYAGTDGYGVYKTGNGGTNWTQVSSGLTDSRVRALAVDPNVTTTLYASVGSGVFKSYDGASSWIPTGLTNPPAAALAIDLAAPARLYAATGGGVFMTVDGGVNWGTINAGLPADKGVFVLAIDPTDNSELYAGLSTGVYRMVNWGNWTAANGGLTLPIWALCIDPVNTSTVYAGTDWPDGKVYKITASSAYWTGNRPCGAGVHALAVDPRDSNKVFAGTWPAGAAMSPDGGATWVISHDTNGPSVYAFAIDPVSSTVYAGTSDGVMKVTVEKRPL